MQNRVLSKILQKHELRQCNVLDKISSEKFTTFWFSNQNVVWRKYTFYLIFSCYGLNIALCVAVVVYSQQYKFYFVFQVVERRLVVAKRYDSTLLYTF